VAGGDVVIAFAFGFLSCAVVFAGLLYLLHTNGDRYVIAVAARVVDQLAQIRDGRDRRGRASDIYRDALIAVVDAAERDDVPAFDAALIAADNAIADGDEIDGGGR
jgi:hypothetical protein